MRAKERKKEKREKRDKYRYNLIRKKSNSIKLFQYITRDNYKDVMFLLRGELPQVLVLILTQVDNVIARLMLNQLSLKDKTEAIRRLVIIDKVDASTLLLLNRKLYNRLKGVTYSTYDGLDKAIELLQEQDKEVQNMVISELSNQQYKKEADTIKEKVSIKSI